MKCVGPIRLLLYKSLKLIKALTLANLSYVEIANQLSQAGFKTAGGYVSGNTRHAPGDAESFGASPRRVILVRPLFQASRNP